MSINLEEDLKQLKQSAFGDWEIESSQIEIQYPGITAEQFMKFYTDFNPDSDFKSIESKEINDAELSKIYDDLLSYHPETFDELLMYYKVVCAVFLLQQPDVDTYMLHRKINILHKAFTINIWNWDYNPVILHIICKSIFEVTQNSRNLIYFAKTISTINRSSFFISVCLMWAVLFQIIKIEKKMFRFHKFSVLIETVESIQLHANQPKLNDLYMILEIISFLQNVVMHRNSENDLYCMYFKYTNDDLLRLKKWCENVRKIFDFNTTTRNIDYSLISDLIAFDILYMLDNVLQEDYEEPTE